MPTTEVPTSPPGSPQGPIFRRKRPRYEEMESGELLERIGRLEDERSRARRREGIWVSIIFHIALFWFLLYGPKLLWHEPRVINPMEQVRPNQKDVTVLDLPPDALKNVKPKPNAPLSDKNRIAKSPHPAPEPKTIPQIEAMRRAGPPLPPPVAKPGPAPPAPAENTPAPQHRAQAEPKQMAPPAPTEQAQINAPSPAPPVPDFHSGPRSAGEAIQQAMRNSGGPGRSGDYGLNLPSQHPAMNAGVDILSDTMGVDFGSYIKRVIADTYRAWLPIIPESARPPLDKQGRVGIRFKIYPDGSVKQMILEFPSGDVALDRAAWGGITGASPYPPLPKQFKGPYLELRFGFYYNLDPSQSR